MSNQISNINKCSVKRVNFLHTNEKSFCRREFQRSKQEEKAVQNIFRVETYGFLECSFLRHSNQVSKGIDTSRRYHHIGGAHQQWRTNRVWETPKTRVQTLCKDGKYSFRAPALCNPQQRGVSGPSLPSNPLPAFIRKSNDVVKTDSIYVTARGSSDGDESLQNPFYDDDEVVPSKNLDGTISLPRYFEFLKPECVDPALVRFSYDAFLDETSNLELLNLYRSKFLKPVRPHVQVPSSSPIDVRYISKTSFSSSLSIIMEEEEFVAQAGPTTFNSEFFFTDASSPFMKEAIPLPFTSDPLPSLLTIPNRVNALLNRIEKTTVVENVDEITKKINTLVDLLTAKFSAMSTYFSAATIGAVVMDLVYDISNYEMYSLPILVFKVGLKLATLFSLCLPFMPISTPDVPNLQAQSLTATTFLNMFTAAGFIRCGQFMHAIFQIEKGLTSSQNFLSWCLDHLPTFITEYFGFCTPAPEVFRNRYDVFASTILTALDNMDHAYPVTPTTLDFLKTELSYFDCFLTVNTDKEMTTFVQSYRHLRPNCSRIHEYVTNYTKYTTPRLTPFSVVFHGPTRCGKSHLMAHVSHVMAKVNRHEGPEQYVRSSGSDYWDGYRDDTYAVVYDDWLQNTDYEDVAEYFALTTKSHYIVPMASLDSKTVGVKGTLCLSPLVLASTNLFDFQAVSTKINSTDALRARICMRVEMEKVTETYDSSGDFKHLIFYIIDKAGMRRKKMLYHEMMMEMQKLYLAHYSNEARLVAMANTNDELISAMQGLVAQGMVKNFFLCGAGAYAAYFIKNHYAHLLESRLYPIMSMRNKVFSTVAYLISSFCIGYFAGRFTGNVLHEVLDQPVARHSMCIIAIHLNLSLDDFAPDVQMRALRAIDYSTTSTHEMVSTHLDTLASLQKRGNGVELIDAFLKTAIGAYHQMVRDRKGDLQAESRDNSERKIGRPNISAESRDLSEKKIARPILVPQSRDRTQRRADAPKIVSQSDPTLHPKYNSEFFSRQAEMTQVFDKISMVNEVPEVEELLAQGFVDPLATQTAERMLDRMYVATLTRSDTSNFFIAHTDVVNFVNTVHIKNQRLLFSKHFFQDINGNIIANTPTFKYRVILTINMIHHTVDFDASKLTLLLDRSGQTSIDAVLYDFSGTSVPALKENLSAFVREASLSYVVDNDMAFMIGHSLSKGIPQKMQRTINVNPIRRSIGYGAAAKMMYTTAGLTYNAPTSSGDCGSLIILCKPASTEKIFAIHTFGGTQTSFAGAIYITQEMLMRVQPEVAQLVVPHEVRFTTGMMAPTAQALSVEYLGQLDIPMYVSRRTAYVPTPLLYDFETVCKHPSEKYAELDPLVVGCCLFGSNLTTEIHDTAQILRYFENVFPSREAHVLNFDETLNRYGGMDRINLQTSAGFPHVQNGVTKDTLFLVDSATGIVSLRDGSPISSQWFQNYITSWENSCHDSVWVVSLKDELLSPGKLCRVFEIPSIEYTLATRAYYGSWIAMMHENTGRFFSQVGVNPESLEWTALYNRLASHSVQAFDADAANWDKNLLPSILYLSTHAVNAWYRKNDFQWCQEHDNARINLTSSMINAYLICGGSFFRKSKGMCSGWVLTALFNTMCNMVQHLIWFLACAPIEYRDVAFYDQCITTALYGDDSLDVVSEDCIETLNRVSMRDFYAAHFCMEITSSRKDGKMVPIDSLCDTTFLKRGFRLDGPYVKPTLAVKSLVSMLCYIRSGKSVNVQDQLFENMRTYAMFAYFYGPTYYSKVLSYFRHRASTLLLPSYTFYDNMFLYGTFDLSFC